MAGRVLCAVARYSTPSSFKLRALPSILKYPKYVMALRPPRYYGLFRGSFFIIHVQTGVEEH